MSSDLVMDCFELAREIRELDMRAAPYDLRELGYETVLIETPEGKAQYAAEQRAFATRSQALRGRFVAALDGLLALAGTDHDAADDATATVHSGRSRALPVVVP